MELDRAARNARAKEAQQRLAAAWAGDDATSPSFRWSRRLMLLAGIAGLVYAILAASASLSDGSTALRQQWLAQTQPIVDRVAAILPGVAGVTSDLVRRGEPARAAIVGHIITAEWLLFALAFIPAAALLVPERALLRRRADILRRERRRLRPDGVHWAPYVLWPIAWLLMAGLVTDGDSSLQMRHLSFDLARGDAGIFVFWLWISLWWAAAYYFWGRVLIFLTPAEDDTVTRR